MSDDPRSSSEFLKMVEVLKRNGGFSVPSAPAEPAVVPRDIWRCDPMIGFRTPSFEERYIRTTEIESVSVHKDGSILKTKSGDFHVVLVSPSAISELICRIEQRR